MISRSRRHMEAAYYAAIRARKVAHAQVKMQSACRGFIHPLAMTDQEYLSRIGLKALIKILAEVLWLKLLLEARRIASLPDAIQEKEREWQQIESEGVRITRLYEDIQVVIKHWDDSWERADLVDGHYLRKGPYMIYLGHPNTRETILAAPGCPEDVHRGEIRDHYMASKRKSPAFKVSKQTSERWKSALAGL